MKRQLGFVLGVVGSVMVVLGFLNLFGLTAIGPTMGLLVGGAGLCILAMFLIRGASPAGTSS